MKLILFIIRPKIIITPKVLAVNKYLLPWNEFNALSLSICPSVEKKDDADLYRFRYNATTGDGRSTLIMRFFYPEPWPTTITTTKLKYYV